MKDKIERALRDADRVTEWWQQSSRVRRFQIADGRGGEPCELIVVPARRWAHWRQIKAARKGGRTVARLFRDGCPDGAA